MLIVLAPCVQRFRRSSSLLRGTWKRPQARSTAPFCTKICAKRQRTAYSLMPLPGTSGRTPTNTGVSRRPEPLESKPAANSADQVNILPGRARRSHWLEFLESTADNKRHPVQKEGPEATRTLLQETSARIFTLKRAGRFSAALLNRAGLQRECSCNLGTVLLTV